MKRDCLYSPSDTSSNDIKNASSYVLEAVYTPPEHRRKSSLISYGTSNADTFFHNPGNGYAAHALRLLHYILAIPTHLPPYPEVKWGPAPSASAFSTGFANGNVALFNDALFSTLWSDVGREYYARATIGDAEEGREGWIVYNDQSMVVTLADTLNYSSGSSDKDDRNGGWQIRTYPSEIPIHQRAARDRSTFQNHAESGKALLVDSSKSPGALEYHPDRMSVAWPAKYLPDIENTTVPLTQKVPSVLYLPPSSSSSDASAGWAVFTPHYDDHPPPLHPPAPPTLDITDLHLPSCPPESFQRTAKDLLYRLAERARTYGCAKMEIWDADEAVLNAWKEIEGVKIEQVEREMRLGALAWYGPKEDVGKENVVSKQM